MRSLNILVAGGLTITSTLLGCKGNSVTDNTPAEFTAGVQFPPDSAVIGAPMYLKAGIVGGSGGTIVQFYVDDQIALTDSSAPYQYWWNPESVPLGSVHTVKIIAGDKSGHSDTSATRSFFALWRPITQGTSTSYPINIRNIYTRSNDLYIEFRLEFDGTFDLSRWLSNFDCMFFIDSDRNKATGATSIMSGRLPVPLGDIGADYRVILGVNGDSVWRYSGSWVSAIPVRRLRVLSNSNFFEFSVWHSDLGSPAAFNFNAANVNIQPPDVLVYDMVPATGHASYKVDELYYGPPVGVPPSGSSPFAR